MDEGQKMQITRRKIARQIQSGNFSLSDDSYRKLKENYLAVAITMVDIQDGATYLFEKKLECDSRHWKERIQLAEYEEVLKGNASGKGFV